jgi:transmembrane sensor
MPTDIDESASLAEQAVEWWLVLRSGEVSTSRQQEFEHWIGRSPERIAAYLRTALVMKAAQSPSVRWPETTPESLIEEAKRSLRQDRVRMLHERSRPTELTSHRYRSGARRWIMTATASVTVLFAAIGIAWFVSARSQEYATGFGERRAIVLKDGSEVTLNSESRIRVDLRDTRRAVSLEAGEALFRVAQDPSRPFEVDIDQAVIRDVGTEFNVNRRPKGTTITVITGRVAVAPRHVETSNGGSASAHPGTVLLGAADRLFLAGPKWGTTQHDVNVRAAVSWTQSKVVFEHTPLSEAADEFNRYTRGRIEIEGSNLQRREISGVFQTNNPQSFLTFLSKVPGVRIQEKSDGRHVVTQD